jgi:hypothetical protein
MFLILGLGSAILGPVEMYCFYLFTEGGRFHYEGFGFGSLVFASIAWQIIGYYLIAVVCIALGWGHLKLRRWARTLSLAGLYAWLVVGIPLTMVALILLAMYKPMNTISLIAVIALGLVLYPGLPLILLRFYINRNVRLTFETHDSQFYWTERRQQAVLVLAMLLFFYGVVAHVPLFFNGIFPLFGVLLTGLPGITLTTGMILFLAVCTWGMLHGSAWAWWGTLLFLCTIIISMVVTLAPLSFQEIVAVLNLPPLETEVMQNVPLRGWHISLFLSLPLAATFGLLIYTKSHSVSTKEPSVLEE